MQELLDFETMFSKNGISEWPHINMIIRGRYQTHRRRQFSSSIRITPTIVVIVIRDYKI